MFVLGCLIDGCFMCLFGLVKVGFDGCSDFAGFLVGFDGWLFVV